MTDAIMDRGVRGMLEVVEAGRLGEAPPGRLPDTVLRALSELVRCDVVTFIDQDVGIGEQYVGDSWYDGGTAMAPDPPPPGPVDDLFWTLFDSTDVCSYATKTGDDRTVTKLSDFHSSRVWHRMPMRTEVMPELEYSLMCSLPSRLSRVRRLAFFRSGAPDFDERDRTVMTLLRPHLIEIYERQLTTATTTLLTPRQRELMQLVAAGHANAEIATALCLSTHTIRKHLENIFDRLGVNSRMAAVAAAFPRPELSQPWGPVGPG